MSSLCRTARLSCIDYGRLLFLGLWTMPSLYGTARLSCADYGWLHCFRPLGMPSLYGTARLSCADYGWLHCFRPLGLAIFVRDCPSFRHVLIMGDCTVLGRWAMPSLYGTARLSCVLPIYSVLTARFRPLGLPYNSFTYVLLHFFLVVLIFPLDVIFQVYKADVRLLYRLPI